MIDAKFSPNELVHTVAPVNGTIVIGRVNFSTYDTRNKMNIYYIRSPNGRRNPQLRFREDELVQIVEEDLEETAQAILLFQATLPAKSL